MAKRVQLPSQHILNELFEYDPRSGDLVWKIDFGKHKKGGKVGHVFRGKNIRESRGKTYLLACFGGSNYFVHLLIWVMMTGGPPIEEVDHRDRDGLNNRWKNLRECTRSQNQANTGLYKNNKTGIRGVHVYGRKFRAMISKDGKNSHVGYFDTREAAERAWSVAAAKAHGEFAAI